VLIQIAQKPAVPSWLQTLAESPAREAREYRPRPDPIEFTLNDEGDIFKKEAATHRNYMPPHYEPLSGDIVDPKYWKHNKRPDAHPIPEAKKRRIEIHSSEIPHLDQDFRPDREHRRKHKESSERDRERRHKQKRDKSRRKSKRYSSSDDEDARPPNSFLAKEGAQIRENPAIVAGGSAVIGRRRAPQTPPYIRDLEVWHILLYRTLAKLKTTVETGISLIFKIRQAYRSTEFPLSRSEALCAFFKRRQISTAEQHSSDILACDAHQRCAVLTSTCNADTSYSRAAVPTSAFSIPITQYRTRPSSSSAV